MDGGVRKRIVVLPGIGLHRDGVFDMYITGLDLLLEHSFSD